MKFNYSDITEKKRLITPKQRRKIIHVVIAVHLAVIFLPLSFFILADHWKNIRKKDVVVVRLVEIPKDVTSKTVKKSSVRRRSAVKKKKVRKPVKKQVKRTVKNKPVSEPVVPKKNIRKISSKQISKKTVNTVSKKVPAKPKYTPPVPPDDLEVIRPEDLKRVPEKAIEEDDDNDDEVGATYAEQLVGVIYKLWNPPSSQLLNGRKPEVLVKIRFNRYGKVLESKIIKKSGFLPMDRSVAELLKNLTQVLPPPPGEPMEIEFLFVPQE